jgi:hypothetical protein
MRVSLTQLEISRHTIDGHIRDFKALVPQTQHVIFDMQLAFLASVDLFANVEQGVFRALSLLDRPHLVHIAAFC